MLEIPESFAVSKQINETVIGRRVRQVVANHSPHGFAWFQGPPESYPALLEGHTITAAVPEGGNIKIVLDGPWLVLNDGVCPRRLASGQARPAKHQLLMELDDGSALVCTVQMYGGMLAYPAGATDDNPYHISAATKPSPLTDAFDAPYFESLFAAAKPSLSSKAFLATEQRIPGLGNGVLQDILYLCGIHPARKLQTLSGAQTEALFHTVKDTLRRMADMGGRDTEKDLHGTPGGYRTLLSRKTLAYPCPSCGGPLTRKAYLGGNVYFCPVCQPLP